VINLASPPEHSNDHVSQSGHMQFPLLVLHRLHSMGIVIDRWIQIRSYYELQIPFGRNDHYSINKLHAHERLKSELENYSSLMFPHVVGPGQRSNRLLVSLVKACEYGNYLETTEGNQLLPVLHVEDAVSSIERVLESNLGDFSAPPVWYGSINELIQIIEVKLGKKLNRIVTSLSIDDSWPRVNWNPSPLEWKARIQLESIIKECRALL